MTGGQIRNILSFQRPLLGKEIKEWVLENTPRWFPGSKVKLQRSENDCSWSDNE